MRACLDGWRCAKMALSLPSDSPSRTRLRPGRRGPARCIGLPQPAEVVTESRRARPPRRRPSPSPRSSSSFPQFSLTDAPSMTTLLQSLEVHNAAFERLLSLIPAKHYIRTDTDQDQVRPARS